MSPSVVKYGPYGYQTGQPWSIVFEPGEKLREMIINTGAIVDSITFITTKTVRRFGGGNGNSENKITLKDGEYITNISGSIGEWTVNSDITKLKIHTNLCKDGYGPYGGGPYTAYLSEFGSEEVPSNCRVVGLFGTIHHNYVQSIGLYVQKVEEDKKEEKVDEKVEEKNGENVQESNYEKNKKNTEQKRGSLAFFASYRPPVPLDIYSAKYPPMSNRDEALMTDGNSYNYNGQVIPSSALKTILRRPLLRGLGTEDDVNSGRLSGMIFVSERTQNIETLHIALLFRDEPSEAKVFNFAEVYDTFKGVRMEDSGCIAGNFLIYVSTMEPASVPHQPWTAVYKTNLKDGKTERLTLKGARTCRTMIR